LRGARTPYGRITTLAPGGIVSIQPLKSQKDHQYSQSVKKPLVSSIPLTWIPGNGENILIWENSILGEPPLDSIPSTTNIKDFLHAQHLLTIWDISKWHSDETKI